MSNVTEKEVIAVIARESIGAWLGRKIVGRPWPIYGDGPDAAEAYWRELADKAPAAGYKLTEDRT